MTDVHGERLGQVGPFQRYLRQVLPESYVVSKDFSVNLDYLGQTHSGTLVMEKDLPFFG